MKRADYRGIRLRIIGYLGKAKEMLWVEKNGGGSGLELLVFT